jgi:hypothetical protein
MEFITYEQESCLGVFITFFISIIIAVFLAVIEEGYKSVNSLKKICFPILKSLFLECAFWALIISNLMACKIS